MATNDQWVAAARKLALGLLQCDADGEDCGPTFKKDAERYGYTYEFEPPIQYLEGILKRMLITELTEAVRAKKPTDDL